MGTTIIGTGEKPKKSLTWSNFKYAMEIIFVCNPFTMFIFNLFSPERAAIYAHSQKFPPMMWECYSMLASFMPFYWVKYWMELEPIEFDSFKNYFVRSQIKFFTEYCCSKETAHKMTDKAYEKLWKICLENKISNADSYIEVLIAAGPHLSDKRFNQLLEHEKLAAIRQYIGYGAIPKGQVLELINFACRRDEAAIALFAEYVKRYGADAEMISLAFSDEYWNNTEIIRDQIDKAIECYSQKIFVDKHGTTATLPEFAIFCKEKKICTEAQIRMNKDQYELFHQAGRQLSEEAIEHFLSKNNKPMCRRIFRLEPNNGVANEKIYAMINANPELLNLFYMVKDHMERGIKDW